MGLGRPALGLLGRFRCGDSSFGPRCAQSSPRPRPCSELHLSLSVQELGLGRWSRWHGNRRGTFLAQVGEDPRDHAGFGDGGNPPEARSTLATTQDVDSEDPGHQLRPGVAVAGTGARKGLWRVRVGFSLGTSLFVKLPTKGISQLTPHSSLTLCIAKEYCGD